jgi:hypothetical protein
MPQPCTHCALPDKTSGFARESLLKNAAVVLVGESDLFPGKPLAGDADQVWIGHRPGVRGFADSQVLFRGGGIVRAVFALRQSFEQFARFFVSEGGLFSDVADSLGDIHRGVVSTIEVFDL